VDHRLFVSDLDGTLLETDATLSNRSRELLNRAVEEGANFTIATARSVTSMRPLVGELDLRHPIIEINGAYLSEFATGRHLQVCAIDTPMVRRIYDILCARSTTPVVSTFDGERDWVLYTPHVNEGIQRYLDGRRAARDPRPHEVHDPRQHLGGAVVCLTSIDRQETLAHAERELRDTFGDRLQLHQFPDVHHPGWAWLTVHAADATKAQGLRYLMTHLGIEACDVTVFGDQRNDLSMFALAGHAVAVGNAVETVIEAADEVIGTYEDDAVAQYIARAMGVA